MERSNSNQPLLVTKLTIPPFLHRKIVPRIRLNSKLDAAGFPLILVTAPAGFGKTTLIKQWIRQCEAQATWLSLESGDNEPLRFWRYFLRSLDKFYPTAIVQAETELQTVKPQSIEIVLTLLINSMTTLPHDILLILDDYHFITNPAIHDSIAFLLEHLPAHIHLVIITRQDPPLPLARLRVRGQLTEVRATDLRFSHEETAYFLSQVMDLHLTKEDITTLHHLTDGWVAGLQLAALSLQGQEDRQAIANTIKTFSGTHCYVQHYLLEEVWSRLPQDIQNFLLTTSILERLSAPLCDILTEQTNSNELLEWLERAGLFLLPLDYQKYWYRYDHLFGNLLRYSLKQQSPERVMLLHQRASKWFEQQGLTVDATKHALAASDFERTCRLIEQCAWSLLQRGEGILLGTWLAQLPGHLIKARPLLSFFVACTSLTNAHFEEYEQAIFLAEQAWRVENNLDMLSRVFALRAHAALLRSDGPQAIDYAQQALALIPEDETYIRASTLVTLGAGHFLNGELTLAQTTLLEGYHLSQQGHQHAALLVAAIRLGDIQLLQGNLHEAAQTYRQVLLNSGEKILCCKMVAHLRLAEIYREWNDITHATTHWQQAMQWAKHSGREEYATTAEPYVIAARLAWLRDECDQVMTLFEQAMQAAQRFGENRVLRAQIDAYRVQFLLSQGNITSAIQLSNQHAPNGDEMLLYEKEAKILIKTRIAVKEHDTAEVISQLEQMIQHAYHQGRTHHEIALLIMLALALHTQGQTETALHTLERAIMLAEPGGYIRIFVDEGDAMAALLTEYHHRYQKQYHMFSSTYIRTILAAFNPKEQTPIWISTQEHGDIIVEKLSEREQEVLGLIAEGLSNQEIAQKLVVTVSTIKTHLNNIYAKLNVHTRLQAVTRAYDLGILRRYDLDTESFVRPIFSEKA